MGPSPLFIRFIPRVGCNGIETPKNQQFKVAPPRNRGAHKKFRGAISRSSFGPFSVFAIYEAEISPKSLLRPALPNTNPNLNIEVSIK